VYSLVFCLDDFVRVYIDSARERTREQTVCLFAGESPHSIYHLLCARQMRVKDFLVHTSNNVQCETGQIIELEQDGHVSCFSILFRCVSDEYVIPAAVDASSIPVVCT